MKVLLLLIAMVVVSEVAFAQKVHQKVRKDKKKTMKCKSEKKANNTVSVDGYTPENVKKESKKVRKKDYKDFLKDRKKTMDKKQKRKKDKKAPKKAEPTTRLIRSFRIRTGLIIFLCENLPKSHYIKIYEDSLDIYRKISIR